MGGSSCPPYIVMPRFFIGPDQVNLPFVTIQGEDVHHISKVLRLKHGDSVVLADGSGKEYVAVLEDLGPSRATARVKEIRPAHGEPPVDVYLLQGLPKGDKLDFVIQKCTEIGIKKIVPVNMDRTIVRLNHDKAAKRQERWQRIAEEAAKQCQRGIVPKVLPVTDLEQALASLPDSANIIVPWECERYLGAKELLAGLNDGPVAILIGPEGGITPEEIEVARKFKAKTVSLGPRVLRTETAGLVILSLVLYQLGDLGGCTIE